MLFVFIRKIYVHLQMPAANASRGGDFSHADAEDGFPHRNVERFESEFRSARFVENFPFDNVCAAARNTIHSLSVLFEAEARTKLRTHILRLYFVRASALPGYFAHDLPVDYCSRAVRRVFKRIAVIHRQIRVFTFNERTDTAVKT